MQWNSAIFAVFICTISTVFGSQDLFDTKCTRKCNTVTGSLDCWKATTDGFAYGLSTAMIDFCQVILKVGNLPDIKIPWYNISVDILSNQIQKYNLDEDVQQLAKEDIKDIAQSLLDNCFDASLTTDTFEPSCPSCTESQLKQTKQWRITSLFFFSISLFLIFIIFFLYTLRTYHIRRLYVLI